MLKESNMDEIKGDRMKKLILAGLLAIGAFAEDFSDVENTLFGMGYKSCACAIKRVVKEDINTNTDSTTLIGLMSMHEMDCRREEADKLSSHEIERIYAYLESKDIEIYEKGFDACANKLAKQLGQYEGKK